ncbi:hypothetical protein F2Q70_00032738 [Brassica cretica]|uniref:AT-hook motif nuclear-localized protein n=1 Tax=Brassica cretica TaxID=69181 RepID=A0A8S9FFJ1_BRACR|nr:hypothetical protein F2Q70_00032738 [Brassica cretica]
MEDSKEPNQQQQLQPPHGTLTGSYNSNAATLTGPTSTPQAMPHWLSVGDLSQRQPQQPWMQFGNEQPGRGRLRKRRPPGPVKTQLNALGGAGTPFIPDIIEVEAGEDIAAKIVAYTHQAGPREVVILSASGAISSALLNSPSGVVKYEGQYEIVAMSGSFLNTESNGTVTRTGDLSVSLANHNGKIVGGFVAGMLVAWSQVQVGVGSFVPERVVENNPEPASAPATASSGGLNDSKYSPLHQVGNSTPQPPDQMCDLSLWPGSNPHSIVFLVYENSHGGDNQSPAAIMPTIPSPLPPQEHYVTPPLTVIFTVVFLIFIFVGFFTLYFCKCILDTIMQAWHIHHSGEREATNNPLHPPEAPLISGKRNTASNVPFVYLNLTKITLLIGGAGTPFIPDIIEVEAGEDIAAKIVAYTHQAGPREVVILSASGAISSALLNSPSGVVKYEGQYEIVAMSGSFLNTESNDGTLTITGDLSVSLANHNGKIVGGIVAGMLVAGSQVQRVVENNTEPASGPATASGSGGLNDSKSPLHQVGNSTPQPPDQMCDLRLWPGSNPQ